MLLLMMLLLKMVEWLQSGKFVDEKVHIHVAADDVAVENYLHWYFHHNAGGSADNNVAEWATYVFVAGIAVVADVHHGTYYQYDNDAHYN